MNTMFKGVHSSLCKTLTCTPSSVRPRWRYSYSYQTKYATQCLFNHHFSTVNNNKNNTNCDNDRIIMKDMGEGILNIQLNRPKKYNALDMLMFESIANAISQLQQQHNMNDVRCIILSGNGKAFSTGLDVSSIFQFGNSEGTKGMILPQTKIKRLLQRPSGYDQRNDHHLHYLSVKDDSTTDGNTEMTDVDEIHTRGIGNLAQDVAFLWRSLPVPVIAVLHGFCFGGGLQIALGADIRIATSTCKISIMESKFGLIPDMSASITLRELLPIDIAKELTFTGRVLNGKEAKELGLVTKCCILPNNSNHHGDDQENDHTNTIAFEEAMNLAKEIVKQSPDAIAASKLLYQKTWIDATEKESLMLESKLQEKLILSWNQLVKSAKNFGINFINYGKRKDL